MVAKIPTLTLLLRGGEGTGGEGMGEEGKGRGGRGKGEGKGRERVIPVLRYFFFPTSSLHTYYVTFHMPSKRRPGDILVS